MRNLNNIKSLVVRKKEEEEEEEEEEEGKYNIP